MRWLLLLLGNTGECSWGKEHEWVLNIENSAKRTCSRCGREQWLFSRRASTTEPSLQWKYMDGRDLRFL